MYSMIVSLSDVLLRVLTDLSWPVLKDSRTCNIPPLRTLKKLNWPFKLLHNFEDSA